MRFLLLPIVLFGLSAKAFFIRADRSDITCASHVQGMNGWLDIQVKGKTVASIFSGIGETGANAGTAFCEGILGYAANHDKSTVVIDTEQHEINRRLMTIDDLVCQ